LKMKKSVRFLFTYYIYFVIIFYIFFQTRYFLY